MGSTENISYTQFACIGSGFSGIGLGATLQRWYGIKDFRLFERNDQVGGTWLVNKYPGAACDVPSALYSFSFESNPNWTSVLPNKDELLNYLIEVAKKYDINSHTSFNTEVERCEWIQETSRWRITACDLKTGKTFYHESQFLFAGSGQLVGPRELDIPGIETFKGAVFHSSAWRDDVDLTDKNVIVIGNGCTGNQIVPSIVGKTKHLTHLVRSKHWIVPGIETDFAETLQFVTKWIPGSMLIQRFAVYLFAERLARSVPMNKTSQRYRYTQAVKLEKFMRSRAPVEYHDMLIPDFQVGCKRRVFDSGYLDCLHRENITLTNEKGLEVVPEGIRTESRTIPADVIVLANGFKTNHMFDNIEVIGRGGETISQHWDSFGGPEAYNTTSMNGFPNFFILVGKFLPSNTCKQTVDICRSQHPYWPHLHHYGSREFDQLCPPRHQAHPRRPSQLPRTPPRRRGRLRKVDAGRAEENSLVLGVQQLVQLEERKGWAGVEWNDVSVVAGAFLV